MEKEYEPVTVSGYVYTTELQAEIAVQQAADFYNYPGWTQFWVAGYNDPIFWFILSDESLVPVLGQPITFEYLQMTPDS